MPNICSNWEVQNIETRYWLTARRRIHLVQLSINSICLERWGLLNSTFSTRPVYSPHFMPGSEVKEKNWTLSGRFLRLGRMETVLHQFIPHGRAGNAEPCSRLTL